MCLSSTWQEYIRVFALRVFSTLLFAAASACLLCSLPLDVGVEHLGLTKVLSSSYDGYAWVSKHDFHGKTPRGLGGFIWTTATLGSYTEASKVVAFGEHVLDVCSRTIDVAF